MRIARLLLLFVGFILIAALIGGHFNFLHPALDSLSHFRLLLAAAGLLTALPLWISGFRLGAAALAVVSALSITVTTWPLLRGQGVAHAAASGPVYRLLQANLRFDNHTPEEFVRLLAETRPDVATIEEVSPQWTERLKTLTGVYPHLLNCPGKNAMGGVAILSRRPFVDGGLSFCSNEGALAVQAVDFGGAPVTVVAAHLEWPWPKLQPQQLVEMAKPLEAIRLYDRPVLIGGDMNAAPWSQAVATLARATGTKVLPQVWGTWTHIRLPRALAPWLGIPIDNILADGRIRISGAATQRQVGSDHRPILVEFSIMADDAQPAAVNAPS